jgi:hypothetical protein
MFPNPGSRIPDPESRIPSPESWELTCLFDSPTGVLYAPVRERATRVK